MNEKFSRTSVIYPTGIVEPVELNGYCERLYAIAYKSNWDAAKYDRILEHVCKMIRNPNIYDGCVELFKRMKIGSDHLLVFSVNEFNIPRSVAERLLKERVISIKEDHAVVDLEAYFMSCKSYKSRKKIAHGTRYRIYHHPFIRNFLQSNIKSCQVYGETAEDLFRRFVTGYKMATAAGEKIEIELKEPGKVLPGFTGGEYALLMGFWSVYEETEESVALSAVWETMCGTRWSQLHNEIKERFFDECESLVNKVNAMYRMCKSAKWNGRSVDPSVLFGAMGEDKGFYEKKTEGVGGSIGKMKRCHDCDSVSFFMSRPELLYQSGKSVLPIPSGLLTGNEYAELHIYLSYRVLRRIKMGDKASNVILSDTIKGLFGEWSRKSAKHHMERLNQAGYIKGYRMTRRGIEFDAADEKISNEKKETEK